MEHNKTILALGYTEHESNICIIGVVDCNFLMAFDKPAISMQSNSCTFFSVSISLSGNSEG
jgi:hypothetical protein